jgi:hypothetical protein
MHKRLTFLILLTAAFSNTSRAEFVRIGTLSGIAGWLTRGNNAWHSSTSRAWRNFDNNFVETGLVATNTSDIRGLDYDSKNNRMVLMLHDAQTISFHNLDGSFISSIAGAQNGNDVSVDPRDGSVWEAIFGGTVRHYRADGVLLSSFPAGFFLTGIAIDTINNTLLLLRAEGPGGADGPLDDELYEFTTDGVNLGRRWASSAVEGNGLGLEYLPELGTLYVGSRVFADPSRVPEPTTIGFLITVALSLGIARRRKSVPHNRGI